MSFQTCMTDFLLCIITVFVHLMKKHLLLCTGQLWIWVHLKCQSTPIEAKQSWTCLNLSLILRIKQTVCSVHLRRIKGTYYVPFYKIYYKSQVSPECVCEMSAQSTPQIIYCISFWKCLFWVEVETCCFHACLFKYKLPAASCPLFQNRAVLLQLYLRCLLKHLFGFDYHCTEIMHFKPY